MEPEGQPRRTVPDAAELRKFAESAVPIDQGLAAECDANNPLQPQLPADRAPSDQRRADRRSVRSAAPPGRLRQHPR